MYKRGIRSVILHRMTRWSSRRAMGSVVQRDVGETWIIRSTLGRSCQLSLEIWMGTHFPCIEMRRPWKSALSKNLLLVLLLLFRTLLLISTLTSTCSFIFFSCVSIRDPYYVPSYCVYSTHSLKGEWVCKEIRRRLSPCNQQILMPWYEEYF